MKVPEDEKKMGMKKIVKVWDVMNGLTMKQDTNIRRIDEKTCYHPEHGTVVSRASYGSDETWPRSKYYLRERRTYDLKAIKEARFGKTGKSGIQFYHRIAERFTYRYAKIGGVLIWEMYDLDVEEAKEEPRLVCNMEDEKTFWDMFDLDELTDKPILMGYNWKKAIPSRRILFQLYDWVDASLDGWFKGENDCKNLPKKQPWYVGVCDHCEREPCLWRKYENEVRDLDEVNMQFHMQITCKERRHCMYGWIARQLFGSSELKDRKNIFPCLIARVRELAPESDGIYVDIVD